MGCCLALAYVVALVRRSWFAVAGGAPAPVAAFAPPARRPGPGAALVVAVPSPAGAWVPRGRASVGATWMVWAGIAWFVIGVVGMHGLGWFSWAEGSLVVDTAFHSSGLWLAALGASVLVVRA